VNSEILVRSAGDIRDPLNKAMDEATDYTNSIAQTENSDSLEAIKKSGRSELHMLTAGRAQDLAGGDDADLAMGGEPGRQGDHRAVAEIGIQLICGREG